MGDPKFPRKRYATPPHPWKVERITEEKEVTKTYGLKNRREIWKMKSLIRNFRKQARFLSAKLRTGDKQAEKERELLLKRLEVMGLLNPGANLNDVLTINMESIMNRRLQTLVYHMGIATTEHQARQFIVHGHIQINERKVTIPGYLVKKGEETTIKFFVNSPLVSETHPIKMMKGHKEKDTVPLEIPVPKAPMKEA